MKRYYPFGDGGSWEQADPILLVAEALRLFSATISSLGGSNQPGDLGRFGGPAHFSVRILLPSGGPERLLNQLVGVVGGSRSVTTKLDFLSKSDVRLHETTRISVTGGICQPAYPISLEILIDHAPISWEKGKELAAQVNAAIEAAKT